MKFSSKAMTNASEGRREPDPRARKAGLVALAIGLILVMYCNRYVTPRWVELKETRPYDEFFLKNLSIQIESTAQEMKLRPPKDMQIKEKFNFSAPDSNNYQGGLEPMWQCKDPNALDGRKRKLAFVHISKSAGSLIRALLQAYAQTCHAGIALVGSCTSVSLASLQSGDWKNGDSNKKGGMCKLQRAVNRDGTELNETRYFNTTFLETDVDILGGDLPLGTNYKWEDDTGSRVGVQYVVFFRDSIHKYVSGVLTKNQDKRLNDAVALVKMRVTDSLKGGVHYQTNAGYLITPLQKAVFDKYGFILSAEESTNVAMRNLVENNVMIGIVERMSQSLEMMQYVLDEEGVLNAMFEYFGRRDPDGNERTVKLNKSRVSTEAVVAELEKDVDFMKKMKDYVKWDEKLRLFALDLHMRQYESLPKKESDNRKE